MSLNKIWVMITCSFIYSANICLVFIMHLKLVICYLKFLVHFCIPSGLSYTHYDNIFCDECFDEIEKFLEDYITNLSLGRLGMTSKGNFP